MTNSGTSGSNLLTVGNNNATSTFAGVIQNGTALINLSKTGSGNLTLTGANTFTGATTNNGGTLTLGGANALAQSTLVYNGSGSVAFSGGIGGFTIGGLSGSNAANTLTLADVAGGNVTLSVGNNNGTTTYGGVLAGSGGLTKIGSGALTLTNSNSYTGATTLAAGTLNLSNTGAVSNSALTLNTGATLQLRSNTSATFAAASVTPPSATGALTIDVNNNGSGSGGTLTLGNGGTIAYPVNLAPTINVTGGNGYALAIPGTINAPSNTGGPYVFTVNPTTAAVAINNFQTGAYGSTLTFTGSNNATLNGFMLWSNGFDGITVNGANVTLADAVAMGNNRTSGQYNLVLTSGEMNVNNAGAFTNVGSPTAPTLTITAGTLDNTSGAAITTSGNPTQSWNGNFTFGGSNPLNLGTGAVTLGANCQVTVAGWAP